jgi:multiple sugar transport system permease protein
VTITSFITGMGFFAPILALTEGGPWGATGVLALSADRMAFEELPMGRASAAAFTPFALIAVLSLVQFRLLRERS